MDIEDTREMKSVFEDFARLGGSLLGAATGVTRRGRLCTSIKVCRPHWDEALCHRAATELRAEGVRGMGEFAQFHEWLGYLSGRLAGFARRHNIDCCADEADELKLKRWEQRWARYRTYKVSSMQQRNELPPQESVAA